MDVVSLLVGAIGLGAVFLYGCVGEIITEKSGHLNLGIPGIMAAGAAGGCFFVALYVNSLPKASEASWFIVVFLGLFGSALFGAIAGAIYAFLTVSLKCNQNISGLALTTFGAGFSELMRTNFIDRSNFTPAGKIVSLSLPFAKDLGWFGEIFLSHGVFVYLSIAVAIAAYFVLKKTRIGLNLRAVGESPATADAAGIKVDAYKYGGILVGSAIAGIGGFCFIMDRSKGEWEGSATIESYGWLCIALVIFTLWKPNLAIVGSILFGALYILPFKITATMSTASKELWKIVPYIVTVVVLLIISIKNSKENQPPASLGLTYFREDR